MQSDLLAAGDINGLAGDCEMIDDDGANGDETVEEKGLSCPCAMSTFVIVFDMMSREILDSL